MQKFIGFDFLRAIFSIAIVADHTGLFTLATIHGVDTATNILYANFSYIGVPAFLQISLFLFYVKSKRGSFIKLFTKRIYKLIYLYMFWVTSLVLFKVFFKEGSAEILKLGSLSVRGWIEFIVSGGSSPFYFLFSLIFVTVAAATLVLVLKRLASFSMKIIISYGLLFICCISIFLFSLINSTATNINSSEANSLLVVISNIFNWNYNPLNFLPYVCTAAIVAEEFDRGKLEGNSPVLKLKLWVLFCLFLMFTLAEWLLLENLISYARLSLVFGSWLLLYLALLSTVTVPYLIRFFSEYSLGIYALHLFLTHVFLANNAHFLSILSNLAPGLDIVVEFLLVLSVTVAITFIFKKTAGLKSFV